MFKFHGYSGPCSKEPLPKAVPKSIADIAAERDELLVALREMCDCYIGNTFDAYKGNAAEFAVRRLRSWEAARALLAKYDEA
jgi:hypothetical protein